MKCPKCQAENPGDSQFCAKCGSPLPYQEGYASIPTKTVQSVVTQLETGSTFAGRYQVVEELGRGGMGRVYKVLDTELKEKIALKLLKPQIATDEDTIERFRNELKMARNVTHKNICRMYDLGKFEGNYFITMEYVSGEDLKSMLGMMGKLGPAKSVSIGMQICDGLLEAHKLGVVHRDLKPQNIMIDREGKIRIMDFGIARSLKSKGITGAGVMIGTPEYMSPEQAEARDVDRRSDIYSLGVILYELATGQLPFEGETHLSIAMKHKGEIPREPREIDPEIGDELNLLILKCLAKEKEDRYANVADLKEELGRIERGLPSTDTLVSKRQTSTSKQITVTLGPRRLFIPILIAVGILAAILMWQLLSRKDLLPVAGDKPSLAIMYFENGTGDGGYDHWRRGLSSLLISDLQQSKYIDVLSSDRLFSLMKDMDLLEAESYTTEELRELTHLGRSSHVLQGILTKAGNNFRINVTIQDAGTGGLIGSEEVEGQGEESFYRMVDELTSRLKTHFNIPERKLASDIDLDVRNITTASPEAYKYYVEGRKLHHLADYAGSIAVLEKALAIDPEFAMAYRSIAVSYGNRGLTNRRREYLEKAMRYEARLSERERWLIRGDYYRNSESTYDKSLEAYLKVLEDYPDDTTALHNIAVLYQDLEDWDTAIKYYEECVKDESSFIPSYTQCAELLVNLGEYERAREILDSYVRIYPEHQGIPQAYSYSYLVQKQYDLAQQELDRANALNPDDFENQIRQAALFHYQGMWDEAAQGYLRLSTHPEGGARYMSVNGSVDISLLYGQYNRAKTILNFGIPFVVQLGVKWVESEWRAQMAYIHLMRREPDLALKESEGAYAAAFEVANYRWMRVALLFKGLSYIGLGDLDKAQHTADELKAFIEAGMTPNTIRLYHFLLGRIEMNKGDWDKAIKNLEMVVSNRDFTPLFPLVWTIETQHIWHLYSLAYAYFQVQNYPQALEMCDRALGLNFNKIGYGDIFSKCFYLKGRIYQEQGQADEARAGFERFLELWKDADPDMAELIDARSQLASLR